MIGEFGVVYRRVTQDNVRTNASLSTFDYSKSRLIEKRSFPRKVIATTMRYIK